MMHRSRSLAGWLLGLVGCLPLAAETPKSSEPDQTSPAEFVNVARHIPGIVVATPYATASNFMKNAVYARNAAYLRRPVADRLALVQAELTAQGLGLKVLDGYRPLRVQKAMWKLVPDPRYVADPTKGSRHNRGAAVDVTLVNAKGEELEMPTAFDDFTQAAHVDSPAPTETAAKNRSILQDAMKKQGFQPLPTEWWHFDAPDWQTYPVEDVSFEEIDLGLADEGRDAAVLWQRVQQLEATVTDLAQRLNRLEKPVTPPLNDPNPPVGGIELRGQSVGR